MTTVYEKIFQVRTADTDRFDRLKLSRLLHCVQEVAGDHSELLEAGRGQLAEKDLFWAVIRHRVQISQLPVSGETLTVKTWPMPTTRTAYPRAAVAVDSEGRECFRAISMWVLMDANTRAMVLPGKSGVTVEGILCGNELSVPGSLAPKLTDRQALRTVRFTDLDINGHMNNCRYLDWICDLLPSDFHKEAAAAEFTVCYLSEAREDETVTLDWELSEDRVLTVNAGRTDDPLSTGHSRVFAARMQF